MTVRSPDYSRFGYPRVILNGDDIKSPIQLRIGLWPDTSTTANIIRTNKATLVLFFKGEAHYIRLSLERLEELVTARYPRERFSAKIVSVREDVAKYADIASGIQIELKNSKEVIERWS